MRAGTEPREPSPLRIRDFRLLFGGFAISSAGDWLYSVALIVYIFERTGSAAWVGAASILRLAPYVLLGPFGGVLADRYDKRRVLLASDLVRAAAMGLIALVSLADGPLVLILALVFISTAAGTPDGPAIGSLVPLICSENQLSRANALLGTVENVAMIAGPALGGLLLIVGSPSAAFALNGLTFVAAAIAASLVQVEGKPKQSDAPGGVIEQLKDGIGVVAKASGIPLMMMFIFLAGLFYGHELTLIVLIAEQKLGLGGEGVGWLNAAVGVGGISAAGLASKMASSKRSDLMLLIALVGGIAPYAVLSFSDAVVVGMLAMATIGGASIALDVVATTTLQRTMPPEIHARILSLVDSVAVAGILIGSVVAPTAVNALGLDNTLLAMGSVPLLALLAGPRLGRLSRQAHARMEELEPTVELLSRSGLFEGAPRQSLEAIASVGTRLAISTGDVVVEEGAPAEEIYLIVSGTFDVTFRGGADSPTTVNSLGPGDHFGEIGVLAAIPRTASVVATSSAEVIRLPGRVLTDIVNQEPTASTSIIDGMVGRLARTHPSLAATKGKELKDAH